MMFKLKADASFEAENLPNAFYKLSTYFYSLATEEKVESIFESGEISLNFDLGVKS